MERGKLIFKLADLIERDAAELATLDALDNGKAYKIALEVDIAESIGCDATPGMGRGNFELTVAAAPDHGASCMALGGAGRRERSVEHAHRGDDGEL